MTEKTVEETMYYLVDMGIIETTAIDEDGNFCYGLTEYGREVAEEAKRLGLR